MQHQQARCCMPRMPCNGLTLGLPCMADYAAGKFFCLFQLCSFACSNERKKKLRRIAAPHLFEYKVIAVCSQITTCFSAVNIANYVEYKLDFLALLISTVNHATAPSIMQQCRC
jgi:hypothetical protein